MAMLELSYWGEVMVVQAFQAQLWPYQAQILGDPQEEYLGILPTEEPGKDPPAPVLVHLKHL